MFMAQLITVRKAAEMLGISERTAYKLIAENAIRAIHIGGRLRIDPKSLPNMSDSPTQAVTNGRVLDSNMQPVQRILDSMSLELQQLKSGFVDLEQLASVHHSLSQLGIAGIYPPRRISPDTWGAIQAALQRATGEVRLLGVALRGFLFQDGHFYDLIRKKLAASKDGIHIKALIVYPYGDAARARAVAEGTTEFAELSRDPSKRDKFERAFRESQLFLDISRSVRNATKLQEVFPDKVEVKAIDIHPAVHMVQTEEIMFIEIYHFGKARANVPGVLIGGCVGEQVPMLQVERESNLYTLLDASFDHMWSESNPFLKTISLKRVSKELDNQSSFSHQQASN
jgi:excisionase family DNA binding protein